MRVNTTNSSFFVYISNKVESTVLSMPLISFVVDVLNAMINTPTS